MEILGDAFPELRSHPGTSMTPEKVAQVILEEEVRAWPRALRSRPAPRLFRAIDGGRKSDSCAHPKRGSVRLPLYRIRNSSVYSCFYHNMACDPEIWAASFAIFWRSSQRRSLTFTAAVGGGQVSFLRTLDKGISQFDKFAAEDRASGRISGPHAFMLYDTFGFPVDLTVLMAEEKGLAVDKAGYEACMAEQRARSRGEGKEGDKVIVLEAEQTDRLAKELAVPATDDSARYNWVAKGSGPRLPATVRAIWDGKSFLQEAPEGETVGVVTDATSFYAESGGQLFDTGKITTADGTVFVVSNVQKFGAYILHIGTLGSGAVRVGGRVDLEVDYERRALCAANHTSTHLLNWALRKVLAGSTIDQRGSIVGPDKLRFDFSYGKPLKTEELAEVQTLVRELIAAKCPVQRQEVALAAAKQVGCRPRERAGAAPPCPRAAWLCCAAGGGRCGVCACSMYGASRLFLASAVIFNPHITADGLTRCS